MPQSKVSENQLLDRLTDVFRLYGYEGASLSMISKATGLQRASLYHRFPGGKQDMADAVLAKADDWFASHILAPLTQDGEPAKRVKKMAQRLSTFYGAGKQSCLLDALSLGDATNALQRHVGRSFAGWVDAMTAMAKEAGSKPAEARRRAEDALVQIQGALVFARATGNTKPFDRVLANLPDLLTGSRNG